MSNRKNRGEAMQQKFNITGMTCSACVNHVEKAVYSLDGIENVTVNLMTNSMQVTYDSSLDENTIIQAVKDALDGKNCIGDRLFFNGYNYEKNRGHQNAIRISNHLFW